MKYSGIQVGRGLAALAVVIFHAKMTLIRFSPADYTLFPVVGKFGFYGVHFFFVISGFIIFHVISQPSFTAGSFAIKRFFRLWPLYALTTIIYIAVYLMQRNLPADGLGYTFQALIKSLAFWPQQKYPLLNTGWSLEHEVIYYAFAAIISGLAGRRVFYCFLVINAIAGQLVFNILPLYAIRLVAWDWHLISALNVYFLIGATCYLAKDVAKSMGIALPLLAGAAAVIGGAYYAATIDMAPLKKLVEVPTVGLGSALILMSLLNMDHAAGRMAGIQSTWVYGALHWLGDRSYSLYLVHFIFIAMFQTIHRDHISWPQYAAEPLCALFVLLSIGAAALTYHAVEIPSNRYGIAFAAKLSRRTSTPDMQAQPAV